MEQSSFDVHLVELLLLFVFVLLFPFCPELLQAPLLQLCLDPQSLLDWQAALTDWHLDFTHRCDRLQSSLTWQFVEGDLQAAFKHD